MVFLIAILILLLLFILITLACFHTAYYSSPKRKEDPRHIPHSEQYQQVADGILALVDNVEAYPFEWVHIKSRDGLMLAARYYHVADGAPVIIAFHGFRSTSLRDCGGIFKVAMELGFNVLLPDMRGHGQSQGRIITMGILERYDALSWVQYVLQRLGEDTKIVLAGCSMGAATVMMSAELMPPQVKGIACDCGYSSPKDIMKKVCAKMHMQPSAAYFFLKLSARVLGHFNIEESSSVQSLANSSIPALLVHGDQDNYVPCSMVLENYDACGAENKMLLIVPGAGHGLSFLVDEAAYRKALMDFFRKIDLI